MHDTEEVLLKGFFDLLDEKTMDKITIQDLADYCHVNRNTFYYHFDNIYDLLEKLFLRQTQAALSYIEEGESFENCMRAIIDFVLCNQNRARHMISSSRDERMTTLLGDSFYTIVKAYLEKYYIIEEDEKDNEEFLLNFCRFAFVGMMMQWIEDGMDEDASSQFVDQLVRYTGSNLDIAFKQRENV